MLKISLLGVIVLFISGCAGSVAKQVRESDKDPSYSFDGNYMASVKHPGGRQQMGSGWYNNCNAQDFSALLSIESSEINWKWNDDTILKGFVDSNGRFRIEREIGEGIRGRGTILSNGTVTVVMQGDVNDDVMVGRYVLAIAQFNGNGCTYPVKFTKG